METEPGVDTEASVETEASGEAEDTVEADVTADEDKQAEKQLEVIEININDQENIVGVREVQLPQSWEDFLEEHT